MRRELFGQLEQALMQVTVDLGQRLRGLDEVGMAEPPDLERDLAREAEVATALVLADLLQRRGAALEVDPRIDPGGVRDDPAELEERRAIGALELREHARRHAEAGAGQLVGVAGQRIDQLDQQPHLAERQVRQHLR